MTVKINKLYAQQRHIARLEALLKQNGITHWNPNTPNSYGEHIDNFLIGSDYEDIVDIDFERIEDDRREIEGRIDENNSSSK